ncbi:hypothetical protein HD554DRAFT_2050621 [Boletus coccyginus]|nr:hypothetical protein HD554DRAFT_2050621 [Boletus coccyginus]
MRFEVEYRQLSDLNSQYSVFRFCGRRAASHITAAYIGRFGIEYLTKMVGANYMGGKRNTARAKSRDAVGRAHRRHFGRQRLASALCVTQENRAHPSAITRSSVLPEITLAHARCDASGDTGATSSRGVVSGDRLYSPTPPSYTTRRNKPSKVLGALDISDHTSMRAAIHRILKQPNLIGINTSKLTETAYIETPVAVRRSTDALIHPKDLGTQYSEIVSKQVFHPQVSYPQISRHEPTSLPGTIPNSSHEHTESGILSPPDSPPGICGVTFRDAFDDSGYAEVQSFAGTNPCFRTERNGPEGPNAFLGDVVYPLPRSSPFSSSSRSSNNSILDLDTSPRAAIHPGRSDGLSEDVDYVDASSLRSIHRPIFPRSTISSFTDLNEEDLAAKRSRTVCCNDSCTFPSTGNNDFQDLFSSESGRGSICDLASLVVAEDDLPSDISIDLLSDPHPWETIGRILKLEPPDPSTLQSVEINFTKDREGVGYISPEMSGTCSARSSDATSFETMINDKPTHDIRVASSADLHIFEIAGPEVPDADDPMAANTPDSLCANNSTRLLLDAEPPFKTRNEVDPCTLNEHARSSNPLAIIVGTTAAEPDVDVTFDGPCLFGDSDLEEDA